MKYSMNMLLWATEVNEPHYGLIERLKKIGYDGLEIPVFDLTPQKYAALGAQLDANGLERTAVTVCSAENNPISESSAVRKSAVEYLKRAVDMCHTLKADRLCGPIHSAIGVFSGAMPTANEWSRCKEVLSAVADHARQAGVTLVVEYLNRFECYLLTCAADATRLVKEINHPHVKTMYDTFHANIEEKCLATAIKTMAPVMAQCHISENDRSTPGEGNVDWDTTFKTLKEVGYDGWMTVEAFGLALPALAAATKIWRRMYTSEEALAANALKFMKTRWER